MPKDVVSALKSFGGLFRRKREPTLGPNQVGEVPSLSPLSSGVLQQDNPEEQISSKEAVDPEALSSRTLPMLLMEQAMQSEPESLDFSPLSAATGSRRPAPIPQETFYPEYEGPPGQFLPSYEEEGDELFNTLMQQTVHQPKPLPTVNPTDYDGSSLEQKRAELQRTRPTVNPMWKPGYNWNRN